MQRQYIINSHTRTHTHTGSKQEIITSLRLSRNAGLFCFYFTVAEEARPHFPPEHKYYISSFFIKISFKCESLEKRRGAESVVDQWSNVLIKHRCVCV